MLAPERAGRVAVAGAATHRPGPPCSCRKKLNRRGRFFSTTSQTSEVALRGGSRSSRNLPRLHVKASIRCAIKSIKPFGHDALEALSLPFFDRPGAQKQLTSETGLSCIQLALNRAFSPRTRRRREACIKRSLAGLTLRAEHTSSLPSHRARQPQPLCDADSQHLSSSILQIITRVLWPVSVTISTDHDHQSIPAVQCVKDHDIFFSPKQKPGPGLARKHRWSRPGFFLQKTLLTCDHGYSIKETLLLGS